jgi:hypothetical protein
MFSTRGAAPVIRRARSRFAAAHEGEVLRPGFGAGGVEQPRQAVQAPVIDGHRRRQPERDPMQHQRHLRRERAQRPEIGAGGAGVIVGDHLDDIDAVEMGENAGGERGPPAEAEAIA